MIHQLCDAKWRFVRVRQRMCRLLRAQQRSKTHQGFAFLRFPIACDQSHARIFECKCIVRANRNAVVETMPATFSCSLALLKARSKSLRLVLLIGLWHAGFERSPPRLVRAPDREKA